MARPSTRARCSFAQNRVISWGTNSTKPRFKSSAVSQSHGHPAPSESDATLRDVRERSPEEAESGEAAGRAPCGEMVVAASPDSEISVSERRAADKVYRGLVDIIVPITRYFSAGRTPRTRGRTGHRPPPSR